MRIIKESTQVFDGTFVDGNTFIDADGNAYVLHKSIFDSNNDSNKDKKGGGGGGGPQQPPEGPPPDPERKSPVSNQIYFDIHRQIAYKWDEAQKQFVEEPKETKRISKIFNGA